MRSIPIALVGFLFLSCPLTSTAFCIDNRKAANRVQSSVLAVPTPTDVALEGGANDGDSRRTFLTTASATLACAFADPAVSHAAYGEDAKIMIPDIVQGLSDRNNKQCLVESLGNRECLVYLDPENQLYKGSDATLLFERLGGSMTALKDVPAYIESKQWTKVLGVLTGPMGTLSSTMNELLKITGEKGGARRLSVDIRNDLYAIAGAVDRKDGKGALSACEKAETKLEKFATLVSSS